MKVKVKGLTKFDKWIFRIVLWWTIAIVLIQVGIWHGRRLERICWEIALQEVSQEYEQLLLLERIIKLESGGRHEGVWGDEGKSYGIAQFQEKTFYWLAEKANIENPNWKDEWQQIILLAWAVKNGYGGLWTSVKNIEKEVDDFLVTYERAKEK